MDKPQSVINWLNRYADLNQQLKDHRHKRNLMIFAAHDNGMTTVAIAKLFDMQQQNVSHIIRNRAAYEVGKSVKRDD